MRTVTVRISGHVQGVWYRGWTIVEAQRLGLDGWVRNRMDGTVEALFSGTADAVNGMVEACRRGPPAAVVTAVSIEEALPPDGAGFHQLPTV